MLNISIFGEGILLLYSKYFESEVVFESEIVFFLSQDHKANVDKNQVQSLLVLELMTLQLFYGLQGQSHLIGSEETAHARLTVMPNGSRDVLIQSMEGLLEVISCAVILKIYPAILHWPIQVFVMFLRLND